MQLKVLPVPRLYMDVSFQKRRRQYIATFDGNTSFKVNFKCTAKIGNGYWQSVEEDTIVKRQVLPLESRSSASSGNSQNITSYSYDKQLLYIQDIVTTHVHKKSKIRFGRIVISY